MSIFKEKDEFIKNAFKNIFNDDSDEELPEKKVTPNDSEAHDLESIVKDEESLHLAKKLRSEEDTTKTDELQSPGVSVSDHDLQAGQSEIGEGIGTEKGENEVNENNSDEMGVKDTGDTLEKLTMSPCIIECIDIDNDIESPQSRPGPNLRKRKKHQRNSPVDGGQVITISDDEHPTHQSNASLEETSPVVPLEANVSQDLEDFEFNLKIIVAGMYEQFQTTFKTPLDRTLEDFLRRYQTQAKHLILTLQGIPISISESPYSLKLTPGSIIKAVVVSDQQARTCESIPNGIAVKLQDGNRKHTKEFNIMKDDKLIELKKSYANQFSIDSVDRIRLVFDGDVIDDDSTPDDLEIEDGCVIDVQIVG